MPKSTVNLERVSQKKKFKSGGKGKKVREGEK